MILHADNVEQKRCTGDPRLLPGCQHHGGPMSIIICDFIFLD